MGHEDLDENARKHDPWSGEVQEAGQDLPDDTAAGAVDDDTAAGAVDGDTDKLSDDDK